MAHVNLFSQRKRVPLLNGFARIASFTLLAGLFAAQASGQQVALSLSSGSGLPGSTVTLSLTMTATGAQPSGLQWDLTYPAASITGVIGTKGPTATAAGKDLTCNPLGTGVLRCLVVALNTTIIEDGTVATFAFTIASGASSGPLSVTLSGMSATSGAGSPIPTSGSGGVITVLPPAPTVTLTGISCAPTSVNAPGTSTCTVTLSGAAPAGGFVVSLSDNSASVSEPASVTVAAGSASAPFTATVSSVTSDQTAVITASAGGVTRTFTLSLVAPTQLSSLSCTPGSLGSGQSSTCTVTLTKAATSTATVTLSSSTGLLSVPASLTINTGASSGTFSATAGTVTSDQTATVTASWSGTTRTASVSLVAATALSGLSCTPASVSGPGTSNCTVTLSGSAPAGGLAVTLADNSANVTVPGSVTVPAGSSSAQFTATVSSVSSDQTTVITASAGAVTRTTVVTLLAQTQSQGPVQLSSLACTPGTLGTGQSATCTLTLTQAATTAETVLLVSSHSVLSVPPSVMVGAGYATAQFQATAAASAASQDVTLTATLAGSSVQQTLSVLSISAPIITSPSHVGASATVPVRFDITASDPQGLPVDLTVAGVPAGAGYDRNSGQFAWVPQGSQAGLHALTATARNSAGASSVRVIQIRVLSEMASIFTGRNAAYVESRDFCSPGSWVSLFGLAFTTLDPIVADTLPLPLRLGGVEVKVNDSAAPLLFVSNSQINFQCPRVPEPGAALQVTVNAETGVTTRPLGGIMYEATPGLFTLDSSGTGQGAVLIAGSYDLAMPRTEGIPSRPARRGMQPPEFLSIYANGLGPTVENVPVGSPAPLDHVIRMQRAPRVFLGGVEVVSDFAGLTPGAIGLYQINVPVTADVPIGPAVPLRVEVTRSDGTVVSSNEVTVAIQ